MAYRRTGKTSLSTRPFLVLSLLSNSRVHSFSILGQLPTLSRRTNHQSTATPIDPSGWPDRFPAKEHCSKCGLCETSFVSKVTEACAFLDEGMARIDSMETKVHGRQRKADMVWSMDSSSILADGGGAEEARFGVLYTPVMLAKGTVQGAQWTGCVTSIALAALESGMVDAVVCIANENGGTWSSPEPIIAKTTQEVLKGRGVKPALAPSLRVLDRIKADSSIRKLLFCGVGCAVQAFRAVEDDLGLEAVYVLGTNCADNSPTPEAAQDFLKNGVQVGSDQDKVQGYEFMQDFKVHVKTEDSYITKPYFTLPGTIAETSIASSCLSCFDYTNGLADVVVGYMGAPLVANARMDQSFQTLTIRNERGAQMIKAAVDASRITIGEQATGSGSHEKLASATVGSDSIILKMVGKPVPEQGLPGWLGEIMAFAMRNIGPKGINFARYSIDYHILRNYLHVLDTWGKERSKICLPQYAQQIVNHYLENDRVMELLVQTVTSKKNQIPARSPTVYAESESDP